MMRYLLLILAGAALGLVVGGVTGFLGCLVYDRLFPVSMAASGKDWSALGRMFAYYAVIAVCAVLGLIGGAFAGAHYGGRGQA
jgi:hypothetical protein